MENELRILDYEEVLNELNRITKNPSFKKMKSVNTVCDNIEIPYYTFGNGDNHIVICGGTHGSEIISVDFVLRLMEAISKKEKPFDNLDDFTFHFIPVHNPEGYIVSTSAIRTLIKRGTSEEEIEKISKEYFMSYRQDDINAKNNPDDKSLKKHQKMFEDVTYECIPKKYPMLRKNIKNIYSNPLIPKGSMVVHRGNGLGIETNRSTLSKALTNKNDSIYGTNRYNNIRIDIKGPLGIFPLKENIVENKFLKDLLEKLYKEKKYCGMLTYHGTGGLIYSKISTDDENYIFDEVDENYIKDKYTKNVINDFLARKYQEKTKYTTPNDSEKPGYRIIKNPSLKGFDEVLRHKFPGVLLIELSYMGGNPLGPLGDKENNYIPTIKYNFLATYDFFKNCKNLKDVMYGEAYLFDEKVSKEWEEDHKKR